MSVSPYPISDHKCWPLKWSWFLIPYLTLNVVQPVIINNDISWFQFWGGCSFAILSAPSCNCSAILKGIFIKYSGSRLMLSLRDRDKLITLTKMERDNINQMITLSVITISRFHCTVTVMFTVVKKNFPLFIFSFSLSLFFPLDCEN